MWHGGWSYMRAGDQKPKLTRELLGRVLAYARPYWKGITGMLVMILITTGISLISPLIFRTMIDQVLPQKNLHELILLGAGAVDPADFQRRDRSHSTAIERIGWRRCNV